MKRNLSQNICIKFEASHSHTESIDCLETVFNDLLSNEICRKDYL